MIINTKSRSLVQISLVLKETKFTLSNPFIFIIKHQSNRWLLQKQPPEVCCKKRPATLLKKRLWHRCFPVNFVKFLRTPFLGNTSGWLLLLLVFFQGSGKIWSGKNRKSWWREGLTIKWTWNLWCNWSKTIMEMANNVKVTIVRIFQCLS